mmetsp:Transcript_18814/g.1652  ORF Transcript_18814/g.1652 Transcript_18814/m.1652 type:complete len:89 (+) Transcript_18814:271-537(+)
MITVLSILIKFIFHFILNIYFLRNKNLTLKLNIFLFLFKLIQTLFQRFKPISHINKPSFLFYFFLQRSFFLNSNHRFFLFFYSINQIP